MATTSETTSPKLFVFVLMPFDSAFDDIYTFGIKGAAVDVGAYAERVDEQMYGEGILDRIFNQINKADVIIADMTERNPNVFYEVGYAHALNKIVVLLTQRAEDIPFDLKHRQHIVYGGKIEELRQELGRRLRWAMQEVVRRGRPVIDESFSVFLQGKDVAKSMPPSEPTLLAVAGTRSRGDKVGDCEVHFAVRNESAHETSPIGHIYVFAHRDSSIWPVSKLGGISGFFDAAAPPDWIPSPAKPADAYDGLDAQYHIKGEVPSLPPGAVEASILRFKYRLGVASPTAKFRLRLHTAGLVHDFFFGLEVKEKTT